MYIRNFLTLLRRYTTSSVLNIVGMAVAFAAVYLIAVQVKFDLSYTALSPTRSASIALNIHRGLVTALGTAIGIVSCPTKLVPLVPKL